MTKRLFPKILAAAALAATAATPYAASARPSPEQQLGKALAGRVAGKPVNCIDPRLNNNTMVIDKTAIIYGSGRTIYLQEPSNANMLDDDTILVTELRGTGQLCTIDIVRLIDRFGLWNRGFVSLNKFVPYTRVATAD